VIEADPQHSTIPLAKSFSNAVTERGETSMPAAQSSPNRWTRDYVFDILRDLEIRYIFGVPGTNEIPIIDGCDIPDNGVTYVQCLHENIAMGAAMGLRSHDGEAYSARVACDTGHGIGNLFNAWKSRVPLVILCGQQQNELVTQEPLLASNLVQAFALVAFLAYFGGWAVAAQVTVVLGYGLYLLQAAILHTWKSVRGEGGLRRLLQSAVPALAFSLLMIYLAIRGMIEAGLSLL
jgi:hypothetical protein